MLFLGAGKKKGPLDREQYVHVLHLLPGRIPLFPSLFTQSLCKMFTLTLGTGADRPSDQSGVHLLTVHLPGTRVKTTARKEHYDVKRKTNESVIYNCKTIKTFFLSFFLNPHLCKLCRVIKGDASSGCSCLDRMTLQSTNRVSKVCAVLLPRSMCRDGEEDALPMPHNGLSTL